MALKLEDYPQLQLIAWNRRQDVCLEEEEAFALYERNWAYVDQAALTVGERELIERLKAIYGNGVLHV